MDPFSICLALAGAGIAKTLISGSDSHDEPDREVSNSDHDSPGCGDYSGYDDSGSSRGETQTTLGDYFDTSSYDSGSYGGGESSGSSDGGSQSSLGDY